MAGRQYLLEEDRAIIRYIIDGHHVTETGGNKVWLQMEDQQVCEGRTWQSLKNRYKKTIVKDLGRPEYGLSLEEKAYLKPVPPNTPKKKLPKTSKKIGVKSSTAPRSDRSRSRTPEGFYSLDMSP